MEISKEDILITVQCFFMKVILEYFGDNTFEREGNSIRVYKKTKTGETFMIFRAKIIENEEGEKKFKVKAEFGISSSIPEEMRNLIREKTMTSINFYLHLNENTDIKNIQVEF